jgi:hypothetical protein
LLRRREHHVTLFSCHKHQCAGTRHLPAESDAREETKGMNDQFELTVEQASRMAATAVTSDLEYWARTACVDGRVGLNDLIRALDVIREDSRPDVARYVYQD